MEELTGKWAQGVAWTDGVRPEDAGDRQPEIGDQTTTESAEEKQAGIRLRAGDGQLGGSREHGR